MEEKETLKFYIIWYNYKYGDDSIMSNINYNLYKIFCAVANSKSYAKSSTKLNLSTPNISMQITNLEKQLDVKLFILHI